MAWTTSSLERAIAPTGRPMSRDDAGEVYIIYGSNSLPATIDLANGEEDVTIYGASAADDFLSFDGTSDDW